MSNSLIPSQTGLTLRRTDTLINLTNKLLAKTGVKGIGEMSDDELWEWWLGVDDEWKWLFLRRGLNLKLWKSNDWDFDEKYNYQIEFDWCDKALVFAYLKQLQQLTCLTLWSSQIQDISILAHLTQLTELYLYSNRIKDISALAHLTKLTSLDLSCNQVQDISELANLTQLTRLGLGGNKIQDISVIANLTQLIRLGLHENAIQDISVLSNLIRLTELTLWSSQVQDISALANLMQLTWLNLSENPIHPQDIDWLKQQLPNCEIDF